MDKKIVSLILSTSMILQTPALAVSTNVNENEKKESKILSFVKKNPIKTACTGLLLLMSPYMIYKYLNGSSKPNEQKKQNDIANDVGVKKSIRTDLKKGDSNSSNSDDVYPEIKGEDLVTYKKDLSLMQKQRRKLNTFGFLAKTCTGCSSMIENLIQLFDDSISFDSKKDSETNNNKTLIEICKKVSRATREGRVDERDLPPFVLIDGNFETSKGPGNTIAQYWCIMEVNSKGEMRSRKSGLPEGTSKICEFVEELQDREGKTLKDSKEKVKTFTWSVHKEILSADPLNECNKLHILSKNNKYNNGSEKNQLSHLSYSMSKDVIPKQGSENPLWREIKN